LEDVTNSVIGFSHINILFSGLLSSLIALIISTLISIYFQKKNDKKQLSDTLMQLNAFLLAEPFLESDTALQKYLTDDKKTNDIKKDKYNLFCIMKYNYLEDFCKYYKYDIKKINKNINIKEYLRDNVKWWSENRKINYESYDKEFRHIIEEIVNES
jgi:hypothetical protein